MVRLRCSEHREFGSIPKPVTIICRIRFLVRSSVPHADIGSVQSRHAAPRIYASMVELIDTLILGISAARRGSLSLPTRTKVINTRPASTVIVRHPGTMEVISLILMRGSMEGVNKEGKSSRLAVNQLP